jgi:short-subunit dehydrogenase
MNDFKEKVVLISGSSRGIGLALAKEFVKEGAKVVINARGDKRLNQAKSELMDMSGEVTAVCGDVGVWKDAKKIVQTAVDRFGCLDIMFNNAGLTMRGEFENLSINVCRRMVNTNLIGSIFLTRAAVQHIVNAGGQIYFVSSIAGLFGTPKSSLYCACKASLTNFCASLRLELSSYGVHTGVIYLGYTENDPEKRILSSSGSLIPPNRPAHHSQKQAAQIILKAVKKRKKKVVMTPIGKLSWFVNRISPALIEKVILEAQSKRWGIYDRFV